MKAVNSTHYPGNCVRQSQVLQPVFSVELRPTSSAARLKEGSGSGPIAVSNASLQSLRGSVSLWMLPSIPVHGALEVREHLRGEFTGTVDRACFRLDVNYRLVLNIDRYRCVSRLSRE